MQTAVETLSGLERKLTVTVPEESVQQQANDKFKELARTARIKGFRPGKIPDAVLRQRFGLAVRQDVLEKLMRSTFTEAIEKEKLKLANSPKIDITQDKEGEAFQYAAVFEVYPVVDLTGLEKITVEKLQGDITDKEVDEAIEKLRKQRAQWQPVKRAAAEGDQVEIDFEGTIKNEPFAGSKAQSLVVELGTDAVFPEFDQHLIGASAAEQREFKIKFSKDASDDLAGKTAKFSVTVKKVLAAKLPKLDGAFAEQMGIKDQTIDALKAEVKKSLNNELQSTSRRIVHRQLLDKIVALHAIELPKSAVEKEMKLLQQQAQWQSKMQHDEQKLPLEQFKSAAEARVKRGLVLAEIVNHFDIKPDSARVRARIEEIAENYKDDPEQVVNWYYGNKRQLAEVESAVVEDQAIEKMLEQVKVSEKTVGLSQIQKIIEKDDSYA